MSKNDASTGIAKQRTGGCSCGALRYELCREPLIVHGCHCTYCQRETGSAFAVNVLIEAGAVRLLRGMPQVLMTPSHSGNGQQIWRCPICKVAVWSNYSTLKSRLRFVRAGTLDYPSGIKPDIHIYTSTKQDWLPLPANARAVKEYYRRSEVWAQASLDRLEAIKTADQPTWTE